MKSKSVIIVCGDPNRIFKSVKFPVIIIGSKKVFKKELKKLKVKINLQNFDNQKKLNKKKIYNIDIPIDLKNLSLVKKNLYIKKSFEVALNLLKKGDMLALINGPISKTTFLKGKFNGITEFLAFKTRSYNEVMFLFNKELSVSPITTHIPINKVAQKIKKRIIVNKISNINNFYKKFLGFKPRIAVTGLNPHCETFKGKDIEKTEILPAVRTLKRKKIKVLGPFSADTVFLEENRKKFNIIVGMYHDQVLGPMKTIFGFDAINITIGLPFIRITPDHGPNYKMFGLNKSNPDSLIQAFSFLNKYAIKA